MFEFDEARILRIFNANGVKMSLKKAFDVARIIFEAHLNRLNEVENNIWDVARKEADRRVEAAFEDGYKQGKAHGERLVTFTNEREHAELVTRAAIYAEREFDHYNLNSRIKCIVHLRKEFPGLTIRSGKAIVDFLSGHGVGVRW